MPYQETSGYNTVFPTSSRGSSGAAKAPKRARAARAAPAPRARAAKAPRAKPACKYGPRDADGYCPKKPAAPARELDAGASILDRPAPKKRKRQTIGAKIEKQVTSSVTRAGQKAALKGVGAVQKAGGVKAILNRQVATGVGTASLSLGATIAAAAAVGIAAFMATTAILNAIKNKKEREQQAAYEAAQAFRKARLELEARTGKKITGDQLKQLYNQFTVGLRNRGW